MSETPRNVLFLCTGNSARSVMAEAILNVHGAGRFHAYSAGSTPSGKVQPIAEELSRAAGYDALLRSKSWDEFAEPGAPHMDIVITVCDSAAGESCPVWPGHPVTAHWSVPDPAAVTGTEEERRRAFRAAWALLQHRVDLMLSLPLERLERLAAQQELREIGTKGTYHEQ
jgi:arsenate reductase